ncbi:hypothetical protein TWF730_002208 [Orbilia blumenaviensis]|uniref:Zn(2)-C6 fungal-type domain-containing protein n=1 Tax=Orbilia blumenaviensis TaxID=1796055 RepID=A0AAV9UGZ3_9PEZI
MNRHSYPPAYGSAPPLQRQGGFPAAHPARKLPYWNPPVRENDSNPKLGSQSASAPRKRVNVACARCRKRKIRCSGDPGDNSGCQNCKSAGVSPGQCLFLRVQCQQLVINEQSAPGLYDRLGHPIYIGNVPAQYACLSAPPVTSGDAGFESQLQMQRPIVDTPYTQTPSLHPSRSMPNIVKRVSQLEQNISDLPGESGLALLARNAEAVSNLPCPAAAYGLTTSAAMETLAAVATPSYVSWGHSPTVESLRSSVENGSANLREGPEGDAGRSFTVPSGLPTPLYFDSPYMHTSAPQIPSNIGLIPTSNVRASNLSTGYDYGHLANIANGVSHMTLALPNGKRTSLSLPNEKCELTTTHATIPFTMGFADHGEGLPSYPARFSKVGGQILSSPIDAYSISGSSSGVSYKAHPDMDVLPSSKPITDTRTPKQPQNSLGKSSSKLVAMTNLMENNTLQEHTSRRVNSTDMMERHALMSPPSLPGSRSMPVQVPTTRTPNNRSSSTGCGPTLGSPKYSFDEAPYGSSHFPRSMKASH